MIHPNATIDEIQRDHGVTKRRAYALRRAATADEAAKGASESLKDQIRALLGDGHVFADTLVLQDALPGHPDTDAVSKAVWALQKQGLVTFYERKHGGGSYLTKIKAPRGTRSSAQSSARHITSPIGRDMTLPRNHGSVASGGPVIRVAPPVAPPEPATAQAEPAVEAPQAEAAPSFPILDTIREKAARASTYEAAAKLLEDIDIETAADLLGRVSLSGIEREYLAYAAACVNEVQR